MATTTSIGKTVEEYTKEQLAEARKAQQAALEAGYPPEALMTQAYYAGIPSLYMYGDPEQMQALQRMSDLYGAYGEAGGYEKTPFADIGARYLAAGEYDPSQFTMADYTARNIQERMSPYEELVAARQKARLEKAYQEGRGQRELEAIRAGTFGGSGSAIQEELARRDYMDRLADMEAQSLQAAFESGAGLYSKEIADRLAAQQAAEQSRQFGQEAEMAGLAGLMTSRQQEAAQTAASKETELAALAGQESTAARQAAMAEQRKNMQIANLAALQAGGQQQEAYRLAKTMYPLDIATAGANIGATAMGNVAPLPSQKPQQPSTWQNVLAGATAVGGLAQGLGGWDGISKIGSTIGGALGLTGAAGGLVPYGLEYRYRGGGLADLEPQYYDAYER